jgi:hypothetical protein
MLRCSSRSYLARYTVILVTSRDCNHITWFRNSAFVSLLATFSHRTWIANDFSSSQFSQKRSKISDCTFWKNFLQTKIFFLTHLLYAKSTLNSDRSYIRRDDVIKCEFDLTFIKKVDSLFNFTDDCRLLSRRTLINFHRLLSRNIW